MRKRLLILSVLLLASSFYVPSADATACYTVDGTTITTGNSCSGSITIPEGITAINGYAFYLANITSITFPNSLETIGEGIFYRNETLTAVTFGTGLKTIGQSAFSETKLTSVSIPNSVTSMGHGAFWGISTLTSITLGTGLTSIPTEAFWGARATSLTIPGNVKTIGLRAFYSNTALTSLTLNEGIEEIGETAFASSTSLTSVTIPQSVFSLSSTAFGGSGVTISESVIARVAATAKARSDAANARVREAAAEAERRAEAARTAARETTANVLKSGGTPSSSDLLSAGFNGINQSNVSALAQELSQLKNPSVADLERAAKKVVTVETMGQSEEMAKRILPSTLAEIGISAMNSPYKASILRKIVLSPSTSRDSFAEIQELANQFLAEAKARVSRTQAIIEKINSRRR